MLKTLSITVPENVFIGKLLLKFFKKMLHLIDNLPRPRSKKRSALPPKRKKHHNSDTDSIKIMVLLWYARGDSNPYTEVMVPKTIVYTNFTTGAYQNKIDYTAKK